MAVPATQHASSVLSQCIVQRAEVHCRIQDPLNKLSHVLGKQEYACILLFISPTSDFSSIANSMVATWPNTPVIGCSTAGEISRNGYEEDTIVAIGFPKDYFIVSDHLVRDLHDISYSALRDHIRKERARLAELQPMWEHEFNYLTIDGLSLAEDAFVSALSMANATVPLFGGSTGDGTRFEDTVILYNGSLHRSAAVLMQFRTRCPVKVFKTDHLSPSKRRIVVTKADPKSRTVHEINAAPAAPEYARMLGKDPKQLTPFTFAAHPLVVRVGDQHFVRAIQRVADNGDLIFFSAIDEGVVLTLATQQDMAEHLNKELSALTRDGTPDIILACDCILRRLEAQEKQKTHDLSRLLRQNNVIGFSTYGEQFNSVHVNQTLTGVAIYPPDLQI